MIARIWRGWAPLASADDYQRHYATEVSENLRAVSGFRGARLLRREDDREVTFTSITFFTDLDAIRGFAGDDYEQAIVEAAARQALDDGSGVSGADAAIAECGPGEAGRGADAPAPLGPLHPPPDPGQSGALHHCRAC